MQIPSGVCVCVYYLRVCVSCIMLVEALTLPLDKAWPQLGVPQAGFCILRHAAVAKLEKWGASRDALKPHKLGAAADLPSNASSPMKSIYLLIVF